MTALVSPRSATAAGRLRFERGHGARVLVSAQRHQAEGDFAWAPQARL